MMKYRHIVICGFMGAGKTTVSSRLAKILGIDFVDTDKFIMKKYNSSIPDIFKKYGEKCFRDMEYEALNYILVQKKAVISTGGGTLTQGKTVKLLKETGVIIVYLNAPFEVVYDRVSDKKDRPLIYQKSKDELQKIYNDRCKGYEELADFVFDATCSPETLCRIIKRDLSI